MHCQYATVLSVKHQAQNNLPAGRLLIMSPEYQTCSAYGSCPAIDNSFTLEQLAWLRIVIDVTHRAWHYVIQISQHFSLKSSQV